VTVRQLFARHAVEGRAVLEGPPEAPTRWLAREPGGDEDDFLVCHDDAEVARPMHGRWVLWGRR
jgi:hypothetical protein